MGSFQQHLAWGLWGLSFLLVGIIVIIINFEVIFNRDFATLVAEYADATSVTYVILLVPVLFIIGVMSPDVDLPRESRHTSLVAKRIAPILGGITIGFGIAKGVDWAISDVDSPLSATLTTIINRDTLGIGWLVAIGVISGIIGIFIVFLALFITDRKAVHWGKIHSVGAAIIIAFPIFLAGIVWTKDLFSAGLLALTFFAGYMNHLINDQIYHELRDKHWRSPRYALKLWSNNWRWDPFILLAELYSPELKEKRKDASKSKKKK